MFESLHSFARCVLIFIFAHFLTIEQQGGFHNCAQSSWCAHNEFTMCTHAHATIVRFVQLTYTCYCALVYIGKSRKAVYTYSSLPPPAAIDWMSAKFALNPHPDLPSMRSASCLLTALFVCLMLLMAELQGDPKRL